MSVTQDDNKLPISKRGGACTCEDEVDLLHHQVGVLGREAHGGLELEDVPVRSVSAEEDLLLLQPGTHQIITRLASLLLNSGFTV